MTNTILNPLIPKIAPLPEGINRPQWSVMIPVYNCIHYLPETLSSVLSQDPGVSFMEIVVVDDCSDDGNVQELVQTIAKHRVQYVRQERNVGSLKNFETCLNLARGEFVHLLHGDDYVMDGYYAKMTELFLTYPSAGAACCNIKYIDQNGGLLNHQPKEQDFEGLLEDWLLKIAKRQRLQYCAVSVRRKVYEHLGGFFGVHYGEDWEMWTRIAASYDFAYTPQSLACYRRHLDSISGRYLKSGENIRNIKWVINEIQQYVPQDKQEEVKTAALQFYGHYTMKMAFSIWHRTRNKKDALHMARQAYTFYKDFHMVLRNIWLLIKIRFRL